MYLVCPIDITNLFKICNCATVLPKNFHSFKTIGNFRSLIQNYTDAQLRDWRPILRNDLEIYNYNQCQ